MALYNLPTSPPKKDDNRGEGMRETCQAEALQPNTLAQIVKDAVMQYYDMTQYVDDVIAEQQERAILVERFQGLCA